MIQGSSLRSDESLYYVNLNRGKKSITLNLKSDEGKQIFNELVKKSDVLLENFRPGTMERLGLGYHDQYGPYRERPGYDIIGQAMGGLMSITGWPDSPPTRCGTAIGDILSALFSCVGILAALNIREHTGEGQHVDVSLVDSVFASLENIPQKYYVEGEVPTRIGNRYEFIYPYDTFKAKDGWVVIGIANDAIWGRFIKATEMSGLGEDERFKTNPRRVENNSALRPFIESWTSERDRDEIVELLNLNRVPSCPIYDIKEVSEDPHIGQAREMVVEVDQPKIGKVRLQGNPVKMSGTKPNPRGPAPSLGGDTFNVLSQLLGLTAREYQRLKETGVA